MTVIEVMPPATSPDTARENKARTLEAAALEIEMRGWCKGTVQDNKGRVCLIGAVMYGSAGAFCAADFFPGRVSLVSLWNDKAAVTADRVTHLLRWRAEEIRDGWDT